MGIYFDELRAQLSDNAHLVVDDGAFMMTATGLATAVEKKLGLVIGVFNDGELSQIAQAQQIPYNRKTCTVLPVA